MLHYESVEVTEAHLEDLVRQAPGLIEEGLRFVDHQRRTLEGRLDVLLVDSGGAIVVAELKIVEDDAMLVQALDYYDYVNSNREALARVYSAAEIDPTQPVRLLLVAPSFSVALLNRVKWFNVPISIYAYRCIQLDVKSKELLPVYIEVKPPQLVEPVQANDLGDILGYITDDETRAKAESLIQLLRTLGPGMSVDPVKGAVSIKRTGRVFAYLWPRRKRFIFGYHGIDSEWVTPTIDGQTDIEDIRSSLQAGYARTRGT